MDRSVILAVMRKSPFLLAIIFLCVGTGVCQQNTPQQKASTDATMQVLKEWVGLQSIWGVPARQPVPDSSLQLIEKTRNTAADGHTVIRYNFRATGLPKDAKYTMERWAVGGSIHPFQPIASDLTLNQNGLVVCGPTNACGDKIQQEYALEVEVPQSIQGGPNRFILTEQSDTKKIWVTGMAIPFPITSVTDGCKLEIIRLTDKGELLLLSGSGFPANQEVTLEENSAGEVHSNCS